MSEIRKWLEAIGVGQYGDALRPTTSTWICSLVSLDVRLRGHRRQVKRRSAGSKCHGFVATPFDKPAICS
jgi:hypothetical protein